MRSPRRARHVERSSFPPYGRTPSERHPMNRWKSNAPLLSAGTGADVSRGGEPSGRYGLARTGHESPWPLLPPLSGPPAILRASMPTPPLETAPDELVGADRVRGGQLGDA